MVALSVATGATASSAGCPVPTLSAAKRAAGNRAAEQYVRERHDEFNANLMGYRRGSRLPRETRHERRTIADQRATRLQFALNPSRLLIRRLLRDHSRAVRKSHSVIGIALTPLEVRTIEFELHFEQATTPIDRYSARCARGDAGGAYFSRHRGRAELRVVNVTRDIGRYLDAYRSRVRYGLLLRVRRVRFSVVALKRVQQRLDGDWLRGDLARLNVEVVSTGIDDERNAIEVDLSNPSPTAAATLRQRYGRAVHMNPHPMSAPVLL